MNKKGFTLIEMLVVIAIIAVLVAIIIPTVSSATNKAAAAANAANLRSIQAEATTDYIAGVDDNTGLVKYTASSKSFEARTGAPAAKKVGDVTPGDLTIAVDEATGLVTAKYGAYGVAEFVAVAENGGTLTVAPAAPEGGAGGAGGEEAGH